MCRGTLLDLAFRIPGGDKNGATSGRTTPRTSGQFSTSVARSGPGDFPRSRDASSESPALDYRAPHPSRLPWITGRLIQVTCLGLPGASSESPALHYLPPCVWRPSQIMDRRERAPRGYNFRPRNQDLAAGPVDGVSGLRLTAGHCLFVVNRIYSGRGSWSLKATQRLSTLRAT